MSIKKWLDVWRAERAWKRAGRPITRVIGKWGSISGASLFHTHSRTAIILNRIGFDKLVAWFRRPRYKYNLRVPTECSHVMAEAEPATIPTLDNKEWFRVEKGLRFNKGLEAVLDPHKSDEENRVIARQYWNEHPRS